MGAVERGRAQGGTGGRDEAGRPSGAWKKKGGGGAGGWLGAGRRRVGRNESAGTNKTGCARASEGLSGASCWGDRWYDDHSMVGPGRR